MEQAGAPTRVSSNPSQASTPTCYHPQPLLLQQQQQTPAPQQPAAQQQNQQQAQPAQSQPAPQQKMAGEDMASPRVPSSGSAQQPPQRQHHVAQQQAPQPQQQEPRPQQDGAVNILTGRSMKSEQLPQVVFEMGSVVARGARSVIKSGLNKQTKARVAIKISKTEVSGPLQSTVLPREVDVMQRLNHPQCICHHKVYFDKERTFHIMELVPGGTIMDRILETRGIAEEDAACTVQSLLQALQYLHENGMCHLNLDPTHIYFMSADPLSPNFYSVKLGGLCLLEGPEDLAEPTGVRDPFFAAPEIIDNAPEARGSPASDMWSVGAILYIMLCSLPPFVYNSPQELADKVKRAAFHFPSPFWDVISDLAKDFIKRLLTAAPERRSTIEACTKHPWMMAVKEVLTAKTPALFRAELLLRRLHIFKDLDPRCQAAIAEKLRLVQVPAGEMIVRHRSSAECMFFVHSGSAQTLVAGEEVDSVSTGGFFGESALLITGHHVADVRSVGTGWKNSRHALRSKDVTELFVLPRADFDAIMLQFPALRARFVAVGAAFVLRVQRAREVLCPQLEMEAAADNEALVDTRPPNATPDGLHRRISFQLDGPPVTVAPGVDKNQDPNIKAKLAAAEAKIQMFERTQESKTCCIS